jgi:hypothetical protein
MNLANKLSDPWILGIIILALLAIALRQHRLYREPFLNYPEQVDPTATPNPDPAVSTANDNYAALLLFIKNNPSQSAGFLTDIQRKFFDRSCTLRSDIDFNDILNFPDGAPFR